MGFPYDSANLENGARLWSRCSTCHQIGDMQRPPISAPNLTGVMGAPAGSQAWSGYSQALQDADFTWTPDRLDAWLASPDEYLPGNNMSFSGLSDETDRRDLIACIAVGAECFQSSR
jgi:cytochrome c